MTQRYDFVLVGDPVGHSRSPAIHQAALTELGIQGSYVAQKADESQLEQFVAKLRQAEIYGMNITMPLKAAAAEAAESLTAEALRSNSVNSLRLSNGSVEGTSTDVIAAREALSAFDQASPVLILGSGGAARAIATSIESQNTYVSARDEAKAAGVADLVEGGAAVRFGASVVGAVVVNATPIGMDGEDLPDGILDVAAGLIDLAYGPSETPSVALMRERGLPTVDGVEFLVSQAAASFKWWTGISPPREAMLRAARNL